MIGKCNTGGGGKPEEEKTVTAGTSVIEVLPSSGKTMKKVTVNPTPSQSKTVTPSTSQQTVSPDSGKLLSQVIVKAMEDVTPEVTAQTPIITQIAENLGVTITTPSGTNKQILQGNNANLLNIKNNAKKEGVYVWKKLTAQGGDFVDFTVSDSPTAYPDGGKQDGYWYEKVVEGKAGIDFGEVTLTTNLTEITVSHNLGVIPSIAAIMVANTTMPGFNETSLNINGNTAANSGGNYQLESNGTKITKTNSNVTFKSYSSTKPFMQATFFWIAVA